MQLPATGYQRLVKQSFWNVQVYCCIGLAVKRYVEYSSCPKHTLKKKRRAFWNIGKEKKIFLTVELALLFYLLYSSCLRCRDPHPKGAKWL